jgi:ribosome maturation factor RimP
VDRPLTEPRHFRRNEGRLVKLTLRDGAELVARIVALDDEGLELEIPGIKGRKPKPARAAFAEIAKARVEIEFSRKEKNEDDDAADIAGDESTEEA